ncbi:MAG: phage portal protein [Caenispirillum sp.]|nr:phage portal protein [Caenispirillum sp.]
MGWLNNTVSAVWRGLGLDRPQNAITGPMDLEEAVRELNGGGGMSTAGIPVTVDAAQRLAAVAACVRVLSDDVAHLPLVLFRSTDGRREPASDLPLYRLLKDRPNEWQTAFEFKQQLQRDKLFRGNGYAYKVRGYRGDVQELIRMHPDRTEPMQDATTLEVRYRYTRLDGRQVILNRSEVFHLRGPSDDGLKGLNPIRLHRETIGDGIALREHGSRFFSNGAKPGGVLQADGKVGPEAKKALREDFEELYRGVENSHRVAILDQGVKYQPMSITMEDAQYLDARKFNRSEICGIYGVPPHKIGDLERATFSNIEHQALEYVHASLLPHLVCWEQAIGRDLIEEEGLYAKFNVSALLRGDAKSRAEALQIQRRNGVISANEWRELEDMNPRTDDGGDGYIVESNMRPDDGSDPKAEPQQRPEPANPWKGNAS